MGGLRKLKRKNIDGYAVEPLHADFEPQAWKLSTRILKLAEPLTADADADSFKGMIALTVLCWNLALLPEDEQERELRSLVKKVSRSEPASVAHDVETQARMLIERKKALFGDDRRMAGDFQVSAEGNSRHLVVISTLAAD
jgi:hypothetical protein